MNSKGFRRVLLVVAALAPLASRAAGGVLTVNSTSDTRNFDCSVTCTLRDAAFLAQDGDTIAFAIASGHQVITLDSGSGGIEPAHSVTIDGTTQPGYAGSPLIEINANLNTFVLALDKASTVRGLVLNNPGAVFLGTGGSSISGCYVGTDFTGMTRVGAGGFVTTYTGNNIIGAAGDAGRNVISGELVLQGGSGNVVSNNYININAAGTGAIDGGTTPEAIDVYGDNNQVFGNFICQPGPGVGVAVHGGVGNRVYRNSIGLDVTGEVALPVSTGILVDNVALPTDQMLIGGVSPGDGNFIVASQYGIQAGAPNVTIQGNLIGTNAVGSVALAGPNAFGILTGPGTLIGGTDPGAGNVISGNYIGISITGGSTLSYTTVQGNLIGVDKANLHQLPNTFAGIKTSSAFDALIGGVAGGGNVIAFNDSSGSPLGAGVLIGGNGHTIKYNSIHSNQGIGIAIDPGGPEPMPNDDCDADGGPNLGQNYPVLTSAATDVGLNKTTVQGTLNSTASTQYSVQFFKNSACDASGNGQGRTFLDQVIVTTDGTCNASFSHDITPFVAPGMILTATATDPNGNTSEFSACRLVVSSGGGLQVVRVEPTSTPPAGGAVIHLEGIGFQPGASVTIGGVAATGVTVVDDGNIDAVTPPLPAGSLLDILVTNTNMQVATLSRGLFENFNDVAAADLFHDYVEDIFREAFTAGCGGGQFCRNASVTRAQMAVFLVKLIHGSSFVPPPAIGIFHDVFPGSFAANFIEQLYNDGLTSGCGGGNYCPNAPVLRQQMTVFLLKVLHGQTYMPPPCRNRFGDVVCTPGIGFPDWDEEFYAENLSGGCSRSPLLFCPTAPVTRGQMAVFIDLSFRILYQF